MSTNGTSVGQHLRDWRRRRHLSQLDLACEAEISTRHLSFLETGRAAPSREMIMRLAEQLDIPLRDRNTLLLAAGFAPAYRERSLDDPALCHVREAIAAVLAAHEPYPALALDRHWTLVSANRSIARLVSSAAPVLLQPPVNVLRLSLHPEGLAPKIANLAQWRAHLLTRLRHQAARSLDPVLLDLVQELSAYPVPPAETHEAEAAGIAVPLRIETEVGLLSFLSATMMFGTPMDVTLSELAIETFLPADAHTAEAVRCLLRPVRQQFEAPAGA